MPRVHYVKKAQKDHPRCGVKKGEPYYWWKFNFGPRMESKTPPKPSQLTRSAFKSTMIEIEERIQGVGTDTEFETEVDSIKTDLENLLDETQGSLDNMPEGLQQGGSGEMLSNRVEEVQNMIDELDGIDLEVDEMDIRAGAEEDYLKGVGKDDKDQLREEQVDEMEEAVNDALEERKQEIVNEIQAVSYEGE